MVATKAVAAAAAATALVAAERPDLVGGLMEMDLVNRTRQATRAMSWRFYGMASLRQRWNALVLS
jgi:hypothetical protein